MPARSVVVVDYGAGNLFSVARGLRAANLEPDFVSDPDGVRRAGALLLPGVGAFGKGMEQMRSRGLAEAVKDFVRTGKPVLGVCVGMQFLFTQSNEFGHHAGLNLIPGQVVPLVAEARWPVPNVGWCTTEFVRDPSGTPFSLGGTAGAKQMDFYFAHSFRCVPDDPADTVARTLYGSAWITAIASRDNVHCCQFHPEISAEAGLGIYRWFQGVT